MASAVDPPAPRKLIPRAVVKASGERIRLASTPPSVDCKTASFHTRHAKRFDRIVRSLSSRSWPSLVARRPTLSSGSGSNEAADGEAP